MELIRKTSLIAALIYGLYGFFSYLNLGVYVPPFPLKPFLVLALLIAFVASSKIGVEKVLNFVFSAWLLSYAFVGQYLLETFLETSSVIFYLEYIEPFVRICSMLLFVIFAFLFSIKSIEKLYQQYILIYISLLMVIFELSNIGQASFDWGIVVFAAFLFGFYRISKQSLMNVNSEGVMYAVNGLGVIILIERLSLIIGN